MKGMMLFELDDDKIYELPCPDDVSVGSIFVTEHGVPLVCQEHDIGNGHLRKYWCMIKTRKP